MRARAFASSHPAKVSAALLLRAVEYGEADVIATLFTELEGKVAVIVRGARKGSKRVGGALEPFHAIEARYEDRRGEVGVLREARVLKVRARLATSLEAMETAGKALRWARHLCPPRTPEPAAWATLNELLDQLDLTPGIDAAEVPALAAAGLRLLADVGYSLDFDRCVRCGKACPADRSGTFDPARGGLVCRECGGASVTVAAPVRAVAMAALRGEKVPPEHAGALLSIVERAMAAHTEYEG
jgi:DNA repair protein RecO (recombination protein O)